MPARPRSVPFPMNALARWSAISRTVNRAAIALCILCLLLMLSISFVGSFYMVATGDSLSWTYSLARLFVPWIGMLSITVAFKSGEHIAMSVLVQRLPGGVAKALAYVNIAVFALFAGLLVWYGWEFFVNSTQYYMVSDQLQVHHRWVAACVPVSGIILLIHLVDGSALLGANDTTASTPSYEGEQP